MGLQTDWISAICSLIGAIVALATLLTVYVAALQVLSRRHLYSLGTSRKALGPWEPKVVSKSPLSMQTHIYTPIVSLPKLVQNNWKPKITFPTGFSSSGDPEDCGLAETSWVNFFEALGLTPDESQFYEMQSESELVNGIVPMRWKGPDLVGICSILGFQSHEDKPSFKTPMPLPMQWSGPLGWLQFRASSDSCIIEYRRRRVFSHQLPMKIHDHYNQSRIQSRDFNLKSRLWQSINGLFLPSSDEKESNEKSTSTSSSSTPPSDEKVTSRDKVLYLGGADRNPKTRGRNVQRTIDEICNEVMEPPEDPTDEQILRIMWGKVSKRPAALRPDGRSKLSESHFLPEFLQAGISGGLKSDGDKETEKSEVFSLCPGLLSVIVEGELTSSRGLDLDCCHEYLRTYSDPGDVEKSTFPYTLGRFCMDGVLLKLLKEAVLCLEPDGFYFVPTYRLYSDIIQIWGHVESKSDQLDLIFPNIKIVDLPKLTTGVGVDEITKNLYYAMALCNVFQDIRANSRAIFTIEDMKIISIASVSLRQIIDTTPKGRDLIWALIASPDLFSNLVQRFEKIDVQSVLNKKVNCKDGVFDCASLPPDDLDIRGEFLVPLMDDGEFSGTQVLAAFLEVFLTYFWINKKWPSDVAVYDATVPQSVIMC